MAVHSGRTDSSEAGKTRSAQARSAAAQRRAMQAKLAAAVMALRTRDERRARWRTPPPGGYL